MWLLGSLKQHLLLDVSNFLDVGFVCEQLVMLDLHEKRHEFADSVFLSVLLLIPIQVISITSVVQDACNIPVVGPEDRVLEDGLL